MKLKYIAMLAASLMAFSACDGLVSNPDSVTPEPEAPDEDGLVITLSKSVIKSDGVDEATLRVYLDGELLTEGYTLYDGESNVLDLPDMTFSASEPGTYEFWASYGIHISETVSIAAIEVDPPVLPEDPEPENLSFYRRIFLTQFTGTGCGYCPLMINSLRRAFADEYWANHAVLAAAHTYAGGDPAYFEGPIAAAFGVSGYPTLVGNMAFSTGYYNVDTAESLMELTEERTETTAGISVASSTDGNLLAVLVSVKSADTREYKVGAWLLEDGIYGKQSNYNSSLEGDFDTHDNCLRIADSRPPRSSYDGYSLGEIKSGDTAEYVFVMELDEEWVFENLHLAVFVTSYDEDLKTWPVNNVVDCGIGETVEFEYE